jgi:6-pyruvoyltetrahydropterin/6-carboxytetrahydropterin synthase
MKVYLHRRYRFAASHRLHAPSLSDAENAAIYGKCNHPHGHGHNYEIELTISGTVDPVTGMVINLTDLDAIVNREIISRFDFANLNCAAEFLHRVPTSENLNTWIYDHLAPLLDGRKLEKVDLRETSNNSFSYAGN